MRVGLLLIFQNFDDELPDSEAWARDLSIAELAEPLGFDILSATEHHFFNYSTSCANVQLLSYWAARTHRIQLLTGAVILPWNDPIRVVEGLTVLDHLSKGRALFGIGRGLAKREYDSFGIDMSESRDRFDESAELIVRALDTGVIEGDGRFYKIPRTEIRPRPTRSFNDRLLAVAMSSDSVPACARLGAQMLCFAQKPWNEMPAHFDRYRALFTEHHRRPAPQPFIADFALCSDSAEQAEELARKHMANAYLCVMEHYDLLGAHFKTMKGYAAYAEMAASTADLLKEKGLSEAARGFADINTFGTPQQILDKLDQRRRLVGDFDYMIQPSFGALPKADVEKTVRLFAAKVMPEIRSWKSAA